MKTFQILEASEKSKVNFIHFNHTNPVLNTESKAYQKVIQKGFQIAEEGQIFVF